MIYVEGEMEEACSFQHCPSLIAIIAIVPFTMGNLVFLKVVNMATSPQRLLLMEGE